jgi:hypothetical protein
MWDYKLQQDGWLRWYRRYVDNGRGGPRADIYGTLAEAVVVATEENKKLIDNIKALSVPDERRESLCLKVEKEVTRKSRLLNEEQLMLQEGIRMHRDAPRLPIEELMIPEHMESLREPLFQLLNETPYIRYANVAKHGIILVRKGESDWSETLRSSSDLAQKVYRDQIAQAFGLSGLDHWGRTKATIRSILLPRANQLLQLASVKRMLDEALARGQRVLVSGNYVFWFEGNGEVGWTVQDDSDSQCNKSGNTLWREGTIVSKNHGRIVVLPYIKESGECVQGHTKNSSKDGKAIPRDPRDYVELPFEVLEDDLMLGLFGELKYE